MESMTILLLLMKLQLCLSKSNMLNRVYKNMGISQNPPYMLLYADSIPQCSYFSTVPWTDENNPQSVLDDALAEASRPLVSEHHDS